MKDTKPQKESVSARSYRNVEGRPTATVPVLKELAEAALALLARDGVTTDGGVNPGDKTWRVTTTTPGGVALEVSCSGPDLPEAVPDETIHPADIPKQLPWAGTHRLAVAAPIVAFDIYWRADAPLRIMTFSRGDWEDGLLALAGVSGR
jgi:hypothetical protein